MSSRLSWMARVEAYLATYYRPHLLQAGVDMTVIALWLGHESPVTTHGYVEADMAMKERALAAITPPATQYKRYRPTDALLWFLEGL